MIVAAQKNTDLVRSFPASSAKCFSLHTQETHSRSVLDAKPAKAAKAGLLLPAEPLPLATLTALASGARR